MSEKLYSLDYLNSLEVGQQQVLALLLALGGFFLLSQPGLYQLQHLSLLTQALSATLRRRRRCCKSRWLCDSLTSHKFTAAILLVDDKKKC